MVSYTTTQQFLLRYVYFLNFSFKLEYIGGKQTNEHLLATRKPSYLVGDMRLLSS
jgi:hypothetical protein